jgi:hypothetical protein
MLKVAVSIRLQLVLCALSLFVVQIPCSAQTSGQTVNQQPSAVDQQIPPAVAKKLEAMEARIEQLEAELKARPPQPPLSAKASAPTPTPSVAAVTTSSSIAAPAAIVSQAHGESTPQAPAAAQVKPQPFSDADWTWLNGNPRTKDIFWDTKFFTPEIRADTNYVFDFNHPTDHSMGGSSELFRSQEVQLEQLGIGGDFHYDNVRARLMTQFGMYSVTTPRNDPSPGHGQWDLDVLHRAVQLLQLR